MKTLVKDGKQREFPSEKAAEMAIEYFGWSEIRPIQAPIEIGTKTVPIQVRRVEPPKIEDDPVAKEPAKVENVPVVKEPAVVKELTEKKVRKSPVRSKSVKK